MNGTEPNVDSLPDIKKHIPNSCFKPSTFLSLYYVARDISAIIVIYMIAGPILHLHKTFYPFADRFGNMHYILENHYYLQVFFTISFWMIQGTLFWAIFVLGHDCGHGSFSKSRRLNFFIGHILHSFIMVPFHPWRISHRKHHKNTGNIDKDEIFYPLRQYRVKNSPWRFWLHRYAVFGWPIAWPLYLIFGYEGKFDFRYSHFNPFSKYFSTKSRKLVIESICWWILFVFLQYLFFRRYNNYMSMWIFYYLVPYLIFCGWLVLVTFLHHNEPGTVWYSNQNWSYVKGNLVTIDRTYGIFESIHHDIGTHVVHHLFPAIPHYYLRQASAHLEPHLKDKQLISSDRTFTAFWRNWFVYKSNIVIPDHVASFRYPTQLFK